MYVEYLKFYFFVAISLFFGTALFYGVKHYSDSVAEIYFASILIFTVALIWPISLSISIIMLIIWLGQKIGVLLEKS